MSDILLVVDPGCWVHCLKGLKSGWGEVISRDGRMCVVKFPPVGYPESMVMIEGTYLIPDHDITEVRKDSPYV